MLDVLVFDCKMRKRPSLDTAKPHRQKPGFIIRNSMKSEIGVTGLNRVTDCLKLFFFNYLNVGGKGADFSELSRVK